LKSTTIPKRPLIKDAIWRGFFSEGYARPTVNHLGSAYELTAKGVAFLGERGAGLNGHEAR
jgi:hypothetical protein